jgi:hypothetical protein
MEFMQRRQDQQQNGQQADNAAPASRPAMSGKRVSMGSSNMRLGMVVLLFSATILAAAVIAYLALGGGSSKPVLESKSVNTGTYQAVFLNGGQVYFGKINTLNNDYLKLSDIYYLRVNQQVQPNQSTTSSSANDVSLAKLGCELHGPEDSMVINRSQVIFWENLKEKGKDEGQVVTAIAKYKADNPNGQKCASQTTSTPTPSPTTPSPTPTPTPTPAKKP